MRNSKIVIVFVALSFLLFIILILMVSKGDSLMVDQIAANYIQTVFSQKTILSLSLLQTLEIKLELVLLQF